MGERILIVDDEPQMRLAMTGVLKRSGHEVDSAENGARALSMLSGGAYTVVISDLRMPSMDGQELLARIHVLYPALAVILVTAFATVESAVACVRSGAANYLQKPFSPEALEQAVDQAVRRKAPHGASEELDVVVAEDPVTQAAIQLAIRAARVEATVLLEAESGAGKEVFARLIHRESPRSQGPFVAVNCAALPRELLEAEIFGHCRGAFTGAVRERRGHFRVADGGTLFLDEIGEMSADLQSKLLRVLQDQMVQPLGSEQPIHVDVRIIAATNLDLREEVARGRFREDLYYRLRVIPIRVPPLRERPADIEPLGRRFTRRYSLREDGISEAAIRHLNSHRWPGNVRELENAIQRAALLAGGEIIEPVHLKLEPALRTAGTAPAQPLSLEQAERETMRTALAETGGNRIRAATTLGISPRTLRHKLKQYRDAGVPILESGR